jgi:hypothetical protein
VRATETGGPFIGGWAALKPGRLCVLLKAADASPLTVFEVQAGAGLPFLGKGAGGYCVIWTQSGTAPAPYTADPTAGSGPIQPGGNVGGIQPSALQGLNNELFQARFKLRLLDTTSPSGAHIDMFDVQAFNPGGANAWGTSNYPAVINARGQMPDPSDDASAALQDEDMTPASAYASQDGWMAADRTELFWIGQAAQPFFQVNWYGADATPDGIGLALEVSGYRYVINPTTRPAGRPGVIAGHPVMVPDGVSVDDIVPVQVQSIFGSSTAAA